MMQCNTNANRFADRQNQERYSSFPHMQLNAKRRCVFWARVNRHKTHTLLYYLNLNGTDRNGPCSYSGSSQNSRQDTYLKSVKTRQTPLLSYTRKKRLSPFTTQAIYTRPRQTYLWINTPGSSNSKFCRPITQELRGGSYWRLNKSRKEERRTRRWRCASSVEKPTYPKWTTSSYGCGKWYLKLHYYIYIYIYIWQFICV